MKISRLIPILQRIARDNPDAEVVIQDGDTGKYLPLNIGFSEEIANAHETPRLPPEKALVVHGLYSEALEPGEQWHWVRALLRRPSR